MSLSLSSTSSPSDASSSPAAEEQTVVRRSPLLSWPDAVAVSEGPDAGLAWHYGDPIGEQRRATTGAALFDLSHRDVLQVPGPDRLEWLHAITSQHLQSLSDGDSTQALVLSPNGHIEQFWTVTELGDRIWIDTEPQQAARVLKYLTMMRFLKQVEPADVSAEFALLRVLGPDTATVLGEAGEPFTGRAIARASGGVVRPTRGGADLLVPRADLAAVADRLRRAGARPAGTWAGEALRVQNREPRLGAEIDHRTIPQEVGLIGTAVHLDKGCYRGQETVARVQNLGRPPRRLVLLHLSGDSDELPPSGTPVERDGRSVGYVGTAVQHWEDGPVALAVLKRNVGGDDALTVAGHPVAVDPDDAEAVTTEGFAGTAGATSTTV